MKIAMINGSPKQSDSTSGALLNDFKSCFPDEVDFKAYDFRKHTIEREIIEELNQFDVLIFAFPLYVDGIPSHLLSCLCEIEDQGIENKHIHVYGIANCGFFEGKQNRHALHILENWCEKIGLVWGQGIGIGGGAALSGMGAVPLGKGPKKNLGSAFNTLAHHILAHQSAKNIYLSINFPRFLYKIAGELGWRQMIRANHLKVKDLGRRLEFVEVPHMIGNIVKVTVDRPLGSYHPEHKDMYYPINYGYIKGIIAPDGEEQDVYILGVDKPLKEFTGRIIAIIHRLDDVEEKWVVAPENVSFTEEEIMAQVHFQEQYFKSEIRM